MIDDCEHGGDPTNDCEGCAYSGDYHYVNGACVRRVKEVYPDCETNKVYTVTECYMADGDVFLELSHAYDNIQAAKEHFTEAARRAKEGMEEQAQENREATIQCADEAGTEVEYYEAEQYWSANLDKYNWHNIEIHERPISSINQIEDEI